MEATLLVELLTEELPPKSLSKLTQAFAGEIFNGLVQHQLKPRDFAGWRVFATPRRLAVSIPKVLDVANDRQGEISGPSVNAAPQAVAGFAKKHGVDVKALEQRDTPKGRIFFANFRVKGAALDAVLANIVSEALKKLPIPKVMRWGSGDAQFVRPAHGLVMMHGTRVVPGEVLGLESGNRTLGHRFMGASKITFVNSDEYEIKLLEEGKVIADFEKRRSEIEKQLQAEAKKQNAGLGEYKILLDEVASLVEHSSVYVGEFDKVFLEVPQECLILTMRQHQKYFPLFDSIGKLLPKFLIVSNMKVADPSNIINGNQRVVAPRLADARFFFEQDKKTPITDRLEALKKVTYQNKLGSQYERAKRIQNLAKNIGIQFKLDDTKLWNLDRAAEWSKCDLVTSMVGEFPELQGIMGKYYLPFWDKSWDVPELAQAIEEHYRPRFSGDILPESDIGCYLALADKLDVLIGIYGIGLIPTGEKDPFALRRHAIGILRILIEKALPLELNWLLGQAAANFRSKVLSETVSRNVQVYIFERLRSYLKDRGYTADEIESVISQNPSRLDLVLPRLEAVRAFRKLPEAASLAIANKRTRNILAKAQGGQDIIDPSLLTENAEKELYKSIQRIEPKSKANYDVGEYTRELSVLATLRPEIDRFFEQVLVNADDPAIRNNRLALLRKLFTLMNSVADISKLAE